MVHKFSYCTQKNTPCNVNAQRWYLVNAINKFKTATTQASKRKYFNTVNYYMSGRAWEVL